MPSSNDRPPSNPFRQLWFRPGRAVETVLAGDRGLTTLALAAVGSILALLDVANDYFHLLAGGASQSLGVAVAIIVLAGAVYGVTGLYIGGWIVAAVARATGGLGSAAGARAAYAWGSVPLLIGLSLALATSFVGGLEARAPWLIILIAVVVLICVLWAIVLATAMLARVQRFGVLRALFCGFVGWFGVPLALALAVRTFAFQPFDIPSGSMVPTLQRGDYLFVSKFAYGYTRYSLPFAPAWFTTRVFAGLPKRGDVVIFVHPRDGTDWVKRIVGLPGDTVQMKGGRLLINGEMAARRRVEPGFKTEGPFGDAIVAPTYDETLPGGATHRIIETDDGHGPLDDTDVFLTPPNAYFVLGDNRDNSVDSRLGTDKGGVGFVPLENIVGRAAMIYYSIDPDAPHGPAPARLERIGLAVE